MATFVDPWWIPGSRQWPQHVPEEALWSGDPLRPTLCLPHPCEYSEPFHCDVNDEVMVMHMGNAVCSSLCPSLWVADSVCDSASDRTLTDPGSSMQWCWPVEQTSSIISPAETFCFSTFNWIFTHIKKSYTVMVWRLGLWNDHLILYLLWCAFPVNNDLIYLNLCDLFIYIYLSTISVFILVSNKKKVIPRPAVCIVSIWALSRNKLYCYFPLSSIDESLQ